MATRRYLRQCSKIRAMEREVRYCTSADGALIAYTLFGEGPPLVRCPGTWESFADRPEEFEVYEVVERGRTTIKYDFRGNGLSQRDAKSFTLDRMVEDLEAVVDTAKLDRFALLGTTLGSPVAIQYAARHPARVSRLVLLTVATESSDLMPQENLRPSSHSFAPTGRWDRNCWPIWGTGQATRLLRSGSPSPTAETSARTPSPLCLPTCTQQAMCATS